jgi:leucyl/phenylalanyl-tRNA---protein transferase
MKFFVNTEPVDESGVVAWSPFIEVDQVIEAYKNGIFPWPDEEGSVFWVSPLKRGCLFFEDIKWSKSDQKFFKNNNLKPLYKVKKNFNFERCIRVCAQVKEDLETATWITDDLIEVYIELNKKNIAHSYEVYDLEENLVGGLYGILMDNFFSAESMFYIRPNASKLALKSMIDDLINIGLSWIDTQVVTDFTFKIGAKEIDRNVFLKLINAKSR